MKTRSIKKLALVLSFLALSAGMVSAQEDDDRFYRDTEFYHIAPVPVNGEYSDWGGFYHDGSLYFTSNRPDPRPWSLVHRTDDRTEAGYYTLYKSGKDSTGQYSEVNLYAKEIGRKYNVGPLYITPDGQTMVVTYNMNKRITMESGGKRFLDYRLELYIFKYDMTKHKWSNPKPFPYNNKNYNCAHGFISDDGQYLYFASDMPGTFGGMDIFVSKWDGSNWGVPRNLGHKVNTSYDEAFPSVSKDGKYLYFSSDKPEGMGGYDIYGVELPVNQSREVVNLGSPLNSAYDDFGLVYYDKCTEGYFSSNRPLMMKDSSMAINDNIYHVHSTLTSLAGSTFSVRVVDSLSGEPIAVDLSCARTDLSGPVVHYSVAAGKKLENVSLYPGKPYKFTATKSAFTPSELTMTPEGKELTVKVPLRTRLTGVVVSNKGAVIPGAMVTVKDDKGHEDVYYTNMSGQFETPYFLGGRELTVTASHKFLEAEEVVTIPVSAKELRPDYSVYMELISPKRISIGAEVLFDLSQYSLRENAKEILDNIIAIMGEQTDVTVLLEGHTDSRGSAVYNEVLSIRRARSVAGYMTEHGIAPSRIKTKGYGYTHLVNDCVKGIECTEDEHQLNRRVEFVFNKPLKK